MKLWNVDLEQVLFPARLLLPEVDEVAACKADVLVFVEAACYDWGQVNVLLSQLQHQKHLEVYQVLGLQGLHGLLGKESGGGQGVDQVGIEDQGIDVSFGQVVKIDQASEDLQTQSKALIGVDVLASGLVILLKQFKNDLIVVILDKQLCFLIFVNLTVPCLTPIQHILNQDQLIVHQKLPISLKIQCLRGFLTHLLASR